MSARYPGRASHNCVCSCSCSVQLASELVLLSAMWTCAELDAGARASSGGGASGVTVSSALMQTWCESVAAVESGEKLCGLDRTVSDVCHALHKALKFGIVRLSTSSHMKACIVAYAYCNRGQEFDGRPEAYAVAGRVDQGDHRTQAVLQCDSLTACMLHT